MQRDPRPRVCYHAAVLTAFILSAVLERTSSTVSCVSVERASSGELCQDGRALDRSFQKAPVGLAGVRDHETHGLHSNNDETHHPASSSLCPGDAVLSGQASQARSRAVFALYGAQNRDLGCAWPMQKHNIVDILTRMGYNVDIFVLEMGNDTVLDGVPFKAGSRRSIADIYEFASVQDVDRSLSTFCNISAACLERGYKLQDCKCTYKKALCKEIFTGKILFAWRQLWQESAVADFLRSSSYDLAVAIESSIYSPTPLAATDINRIQRGLVLRAANNDAGGCTNGLYVGKPQDIGALMSRLTPMYLREAHDWQILGMARDRYRYQNVSRTRASRVWWWYARRHPRWA